MNIPAALSGRRVLVTGATGFLGSSLCRVLHEGDVTFLGVARHLPQADGTFGEYRTIDLSDLAQVRRMWHEFRPQIVFHLAGWADARQSLDLVLPTLSSNVVGTVNLLTLAAETGCERVVMNASMEEPIPEDGELTPASPYAASKLAGTAYAAMFANVFRVPIVSVRIFYTYGPGQIARKVIPHIIGSLLKGEQPVLRSASREVDWIYVDDVIAGLVSAATIPAIEGHSFELGSGRLVSIGAVAEQIARIFGAEVVPGIEAETSGSPEVVRSAQIAQAQRELGWRPRIPLDEGLVRTVAWYRANSSKLEI